jgi:hypothetical protein
MRAIYVSAGLFSLLAAFGLGVVVGRFVMKDGPSKTAFNQGTIPGLFGQNNEFSAAGIPNQDPSQILPVLPNPQEANLTPAQIEASAAANAAKNCSVTASRPMPIRNWNNFGAISAVAVGENCGTAVVRFVLKASDGRTLFTLSAPARDLDVAPDASAETLQAAVERSLPDSAVRAAAYPQWKEGAPTPLGTEFNRETYEAIRAQNAPVICIKLASAPQTCFAADPNSNEIKTLSRG